jgi:hypothetical protein
VQNIILFHFLLRYFIRDNTCIENITLTNLLADEDTKMELVTYLAKKTLNIFGNEASCHKKLFVTADGETKNNFNNQTSKNTHEEADTMVIMHAATLLSKDCQLVVCSPDTDILLLLLHFNSIIPKKTYFFTGTIQHNNKRYISIENLSRQLGSVMSDALPGFHAFTGNSKKELHFF